MTAREFVGPAPIQPLTAPEPPAKLIIDPPLADSLKTGRVVIQYYAQNLHIRPVYGEAARCGIAAHRPHSRLRRRRDVALA